MFRKILLTGVAAGSIMAATGAAFDLLDSTQDINRVASQAGTNAYEILTSLGARYRRQYLPF